MLRKSVLFGAALSMLPFTVTADIIRPDGTTIDCYCTDSTGGRVELGDTICLHVDGRMFLAQCQMSLNNPMWREITEGCATSSLPQDMVQDTVPRG